MWFEQQVTLSLLQSLAFSHRSVTGILTWDAEPNLTLWDINNAPRHLLNKLSSRYFRKKTGSVGPYDPVGPAKRHCRFFWIFPAPSPSIRKQKKEEICVLFWSHPSIKLYPGLGAWKLFCHLWFIHNLVDKTHQPQEHCSAYEHYQSIPTKSNHSKMYLFQSQMQPKLQSW